MTCREADDFLMDYFSGEMPADLRQAFERHLDECSNCRAYLATYDATVRVTRRAHADPDSDAREALPEDLVSAILASIRKPEAT